MLVEIWRTASRFDPERGSARAWALTMAHARAVDRVRSADAAARRDVRAAELMVETPFDEVVEAVEARLDRQRVRRCLEGLTELQRQSVTLAYYGGYTYSQVALLLDISAGNREDPSARRPGPAARLPGGGWMSTMDPEVHSLTGAYVCHALEPAERAAFEHHLAQCPVCAQEVAELQETAALLASAAAETPPARLKTAVDARIAVTRQIPPLIAHIPVRQAPARGRRRWFTVAGWGLATGLAATVAVLGVHVNDQQNRIDQATHNNTAISALLSAPDAHTDSVTVRTGGTGSVVVSRSRDEAAITITGLARLAPGQAYQLWMMGPSAPRSGGLLSADSDGTHGAILAHDLGDAQSIGLTIEPAAGSAQPTTAPVMLLPMPA